MQIRGYQTLDKVGEAGQGKVWRAFQLSTGREVAIKVPHLGSVASERARLRFEREVELAARLRHPNIARVYESGIDSGLHYYVMDFINGTNLDEFVRRNGLGQRQILELMRPICLAVQHAHQMGIIHRDLKPSNIVVTDEGTPYIVDFGLAKRLLDDAQSPVVSMEGETIGTPAYMSPEQARGQTDAIDTRTDIYSLGGILFKLLTGETPHDLSGSRQRVLRRIAEEEIRRPRSVCPGIDRELEWLLSKALDQDPESRYTSAKDLAVDLDNYLSGRSLIAGPPRTSYRLRKFVKRHQVLVSSAALATIAIGASLAACTFLYLQAEIQAQRSQAVSNFLNDSVLSALDPYRSEGGEVTALSVLDSVAASLQGTFADAPLIEASIRNRLGTSYSRFASHEAAIEQLQHALEIRRKRLGDTHPLTVESMYQLGVSYWQQGQANLAEPLLVETIPQFVQRLGPGHYRPLHARLMLANVYVVMGEYRRALQLAQEVLADARLAGGDEHPQAILATVIIGGIYAERGDYEAAETLLLKGAQMAQQVLGEDHGWTPEFTGYVGLTHLQRQDYAKAEVILQDVYDRTRRIFGDQWDTHHALANLIRAHVGLGQFEQARALRNELIASQPRSVDTRNQQALKAEERAAPSGSMHYDSESDTYTITGAGIDIWDVFDEFHFAYKTLDGDGTITARIDSAERVSRRTKVGIMMRDDVEPTSRHASVFIGPGGIVNFQCRKTEKGPARSRRTCVRDMKLPHWLQFQRRGDKFTAYHSNDGKNWIVVRPDDPNEEVSMEVGMNRSLLVGLAVTSEDASRTATARISNVVISGDVSPRGPCATSRDISLLSSGVSVGQTVQKMSETTQVHRNRIVEGDLTDEEIGTLSFRHGVPAGAVKYDSLSDTYTILGSGKDIWSTEDQFHFAWKRLNGDGTIVARVDSVQHLHDWTKAGVMIRNALTADSVQASLVLTPMRRISFQRRLVAGEESDATSTEPGAFTFPYWIKLTRKGNVFTALHSKDGVTWNKIPADTGGGPSSVRLSMADSVCIGLVATSHAGPAITAEAKISRVTVTGDVVPSGQFFWSEDIGFQAIALPKN